MTPTAWPLQMGPIGCPETSVRNYDSRLRKIRKSADLMYTGVEARCHAGWPKLHCLAEATPCRLQLCIVMGISSRKLSDHYDFSRWAACGRSPAEIVGSNPTGAWIFVCCECRVLSGRGLCDELITRPEEFYRLWCVVVCDLETSRISAPYINDISSLRVNLQRSHLRYRKFV